MTDRDYPGLGGRWERRSHSRLGQALTVAQQSLAPAAPPAARPGEMDDTVIEMFEAYTQQHTAPAPAPPPPAPERLVVDLRPPGSNGGPAPRRDGSDFGLGRDWGSTWRWTTQGWVDVESGRPTWRPVVTTTTDFPEWNVDTFLGVVAGESAVASNSDLAVLGEALADGREVALRGLVDAAVARGAHAVVGASVDYTPVGERVLVTATGTAVTLRDR